MGDDAQLAALDGDLKELLSSWFDVGLLYLQRITWSAPAALLKKLACSGTYHQTVIYLKMKWEICLIRATC